MCKLGANCHDVDIEVYFLKEYCHGLICENLKKKKAEKQNIRCARGKKTPVLSVEVSSLGFEGNRAPAHSSSTAALPLHVMT